MSSIYLFIPKNVAYKLINSFSFKICIKIKIPFIVITNTLSIWNEEDKNYKTITNRNGLTFPKSFAYAFYTNVNKVY